jgi:SAM-dependent methyltransferase
MTRKYETETNLENEPTRHAEQPVPADSELAYDRLTSYGFARRYVGRKIVADIGREEAGYGSRLLAETAESVTGVVGSPEDLDLASAVHSSPNLSYQRVDLPQLPFPEDHFDVVVAFGVVESLEHPEDLMREIRRVLKEDGVLVISALDRQTDTNDRDRGGANGRRAMYVAAFRELLGSHFGRVQVYRQGAVAGGFVFPASEEVTGAPVESARFSLADPHFGVEPPVTRSVIAVCSDAETLGQEERPYLLLDRDRRVFDECEERAEDVELLRSEIQRMQETEVQAFVDAIKVRQSLIQELPRYLPHLQNLILERLIHRRNIIYGNIYAVRKKGVKGIARGASRRSSALYRRLRTKSRSSG